MKRRKRPPQQGQLTRRPHSQASRARRSRRARGEALTDARGSRRRWRRRRRPRAPCAAAAARRGSAPRAYSSRRRVEHVEHVVEADRVAPLERAARVVEAEDHARRRCPPALPTPSPSANAASLTSWQTIRPSTSPGASPTHSVCLPERRRRSARRRAAAAVEVAGAARQLDEPSRLERRQRVEADRGAAAGRARPASPPRTADACGPPCSGGSSSARAAVEDQVRDLAVGLLGRRARPSPPPRRARAARAASASVAGDRRRGRSPPPGGGGSGSAARCGPVGVVVAAAAGLAAVRARRRPCGRASGDGRQRGSPKLSS